MDFQYLFDHLDYMEPLIAVYDTLDPSSYKPLTVPDQGGRSCCFAFYKQWQLGKTLHLTPGDHGCRGAKAWCFGVPNLDRENFIRFLADDEGLKSSRELMGAWIDAEKPYQPKHGNLLLGPYRREHIQDAVTLTFLVNPDQLSLLIIGAHYHAHPADPSPVIAPFGSGCMQILCLAAQHEHPVAVIGATDIAMRQHLPPDMMTFTVNMPMAERLAQLDDRSFLAKPFLEKLQKERQGTVL